MVPVNIPLLDGNEAKYLAECIDSGWISSEGPFVRRFEQTFADSLGRQHGVACANGSGALDIAVAAAGIGPGDEVIMPTFTIISPAASVVRAGGVPVLVDSDPVTWNMNVDQIESKITSKTRAILVVHIYGLPVDMDRVIEIAREHDLIVIEDAAEMHGQTYQGQPCGRFGLISTFSFYPNKHITCGEGGMVVTDDDRIAERSRGLRNLCFQVDRRFVHEDLGWNYRMTNMQAAIGLAQLERLGDHVDRKREIGRQYQDRLKGVVGLRLPASQSQHADNIYWVFGVVCEPSLGVSADQLMHRLREAKIGTRPFFWPMHEQPVFQKMGLFTDQHFPEAEYLGRQGFYLPSGLGTSDQQIQQVADSLRMAIEDSRDSSVAT